MRTYIYKTSGAIVEDSRPQAEIYNEACKGLEDRRKREIKYRRKQRRSSYNYKIASFLLGLSLMEI